MKDRDPPVDEASSASDSRVKRSDVGYKRPPIEHQFKKGQKPPPRKKKEAIGQVPVSETFRKILEEPRRVLWGKKVRWLTVADLIMKRAWQEAEKGSATLRRLILRLVLSSEGPGPEQAPLVVSDPTALARKTELRLTLIDEAKS